MFKHVFGRLGRAHGLARTPMRLAGVLAATSVAAISACSEVARPTSEEEQFQLPDPGTSVALDREGSVLATRELWHAPATERGNWVATWTLWRFVSSSSERTPPTGHISTYAGPDPEHSANASDSKAVLDDFGDRVAELHADPVCEVVVVEHFKESGDLHAHCGELPG